MKIIDVPQGSPEWRLARIGIPTASNFGKLVTNTLKDGAYTLSASITPYAHQLAAELFAGKELKDFDGGTTWMERGRVMEEEACDYFAMTHGADVQAVGFITNDAGTAGCSPDRLVGEDSGLEVKCLSAANHVEVMAYQSKHGHAPVKYTQQVQGCLWVTGRKHWNQLYYHPDLPPLVVVQTPDPLQHAAFEKAVAEVIRMRDEHLTVLRSK